MKFVLFNAVVGAALAYLILAERGQAPADWVPDPRRSVAEAVAPASSGDDLPVTADPAPQLDRSPSGGPAAPAPDTVSQRPDAPAGRPGEPRPDPPPSAGPPPDGPRSDPVQAWPHDLPARDLPDRLRDLARTMESRFLAGMK